MTIKFLLRNRFAQTSYFEKFEKICSCKNNVDKNNCTQKISN